MDDKTDPPIEPLGYISGLTVVDIGDYRVSRGMTRRDHSSCFHRNISYDRSERRIWCRDCERDVEPFDAFLGMAEQYDKAVRKLKRREEIVQQAEEHSLHLIAAKEIEKSWRSRNSVPACPHCHHGLFPEHFKTGGTTLGKDYARARLAKEQSSNNPL